MSVSIAEKSNANLFLKELINAGANVNYINEAGENVLHTACSRNDMNIVKILLKSGCDYNLRDNYNGLPVDLIPLPELKKEFSEMIESLHCR